MNAALLLLIFVGLGLLLPVGFGVWLLVRARSQSPGYPACGGCGYDLTGIVDGAIVCPECGGKFTKLGIVPPQVQARRNMRVAGVAFILVPLMIGGLVALVGQRPQPAPPSVIIPFGSLTPANPPAPAFGNSLVAPTFAAPVTDATEVDDGSELIVRPPKVDPAPDPNAKLNILFLGNSLTFSNDLPGMLDALIDATKFGPVHVDSVTDAMSSLGDHWQRPATRAIVENPGWDVVILQQGPSATEGRPSLLRYSKIIGDRVVAGDGRIGLYQVWPEMIYLDTYDLACESYHMAAEQNDGILFPVGEAFRMAKQRDPNIAVLQTDQFHPRTNGIYLAALIMCEQLTGTPAEELPAAFTTKRGREISIPDEQAELLKTVASEANAKFALP